MVRDGGCVAGGTVAILVLSAVDPAVILGFVALGGALVVGTSQRVLRDALRIARSGGEAGAGIRNRAGRAGSDRREKREAVRLRHYGAGLVVFGTVAAVVV